MKVDPHRRYFFPAMMQPSAFGVRRSLYHSLLDKGIWHLEGTFRGATIFPDRQIVAGPRLPTSVP